MRKIKKIKGQTRIYKTLHRKLKIEQHLSMNHLIKKLYKQSINRYIKDKQYKFNIMNDGKLYKGRQTLSMDFKNLI